MCQDAFIQDAFLCHTIRSSAADGAIGKTPLVDFPAASLTSPRCHPLVVSYNLGSADSFQYETLSTADLVSGMSTLVSTDALMSKASVTYATVVTI